MMHLDRVFVTYLVCYIHPLCVSLQQSAVALGEQAVKLSMTGLGLQIYAMTDD